MSTLEARDKIREGERGLCHRVEEHSHVVFYMQEGDPRIATARAVMREAEGVSLILPAGADAELPMRQITLNVYSSLEGVGLTAAVATVLANAGIACNMVAAYHHDHAFVPAARAEEALAFLLNLQDQGA